MRSLLVVVAVAAALATAGTPATAAAIPAGDLSGTVTGDGAPLANVWVTLTPVSGTGVATGNPRRTLTDGSGRYAFPEVLDPEVTIHVRAPLLGEFVDTWWPGEHTLAQAQVIETSDGPVTADVELPVGGSVSGRVVDSTTGDPVPEAQVSALIAASPQSGPVGLASRGPTPGTFAISTLPPVPITLRVQLPMGSSHLAVHPNEWSEGIRIDGGDTTTGLSIALRRGATISGTVRDDRGTPVAGASIRVVGCMPNCPPIVTSDSTGAYRITGVRPGARLGVVAWKGDTLVRQWYPDRDNASLATDIALDVGEELEGIDFALRRAAFLSVAVSAADSGEALTGAIVLLVSTTDPFARHYGLRTRDRPGLMRLGPVTPGTYTVNVLPGSANPGHAALAGSTDQAGGPAAVVTLEPEDDIEIAVALPPTGGPGLRPAVTPVQPAVGWPGLAAGFLAPDADEGGPW